MPPEHNFSILGYIFLAIWVSCGCLEFYLHNRYIPLHFRMSAWAWLRSFGGHLLAGPIILMVGKAERDLDNWMD